MGLTLGIHIGEYKAHFTPQWLDATHLALAGPQWLDATHLALVGLQWECLHIWPPLVPIGLTEGIERCISGLL